MKQLTTNYVEVEDESYKQMFQIRGEEENFSAKTVRFKPYAKVNKIIERDASDPSIVVNETIFFEGVAKGRPIPDKLGGNACGRVFPAWQNGELLTDEQKEAQKNKKWYDYLFGEVYFDKYPPVLVNLRLTGRLGMHFSSYLKNLGRDNGKWPSTVFELTVRGMKGKPQFAEIDITVAQGGLKLEGTEEVFQLITSYIQEHNDNITGNLDA
ncbi:MAG: hypothetical protein EBR82_53240 [Caulobacteraceae bacterium]|nr:hypothetical protein [Caulobacteraceae bacterium]